MKKIFTAAVVSLVAVTALSAAEAAIGKKENFRPVYDYYGTLPKKSGDYGTTYKWIPASYDYARSFKYVDVDSIEEIDERDASSFRHPLAYVWLAGFYEYQAESNEFAAWALNHRGKATFNESPLHYHGGDGEYYLDLCDEETRKKRAEYLARTVKEKNIAGIFFDWGNDKFLEEPEFADMKREFERRHPGKEYWECIYDFYKDLKNKGVTVFANQAYRNPKLMETIDYDMTESYVITDDERDGVPYTIYQPKEEIKEYFDYLTDLKEKAKKKGVFKDIIYMNYAAPKKAGGSYEAPLKDIEYAFSMTKIGGFIPYIEVPYDRTLEFTDLYFYDLGKPVGERVENGKITYREYENGIAMVSDPIKEEKFVEISGIDANMVYDATEKSWFKPENGRITVRFSPHYDPATRKFKPVGKILVYEKEDPVLSLIEYFKNSR